MVGPQDREAAFAGHRIKSKTFLALTLTSIIPWLILTSILHIQVIPLLDASAHWLLIGSLQGVLICTALLMAAGGYVIWDIAAAVVRTAQMVSEASKTTGVAVRADEIGVLMGSFSRMLTTIADQATQIAAFAVQLDAAHKELEATNSRLKDLSFKDEVTNLYNRRFFFMRLAEEVGRYRRFGHPLSLVLLDLDRFKEVNDELGHTAGDETLREVSQLMLEHSRTDNILARYGGDEFAILLVDTAELGAACYAERIRQTLAACPLSHGRPITASLGIASLPNDSIASAEALFRAADEALYEAKRSGKNTIVSYQPATMLAQAQQD
jgi:diguanylate cyclase (GGDEF)-like protein